MNELYELVRAQSIATAETRRAKVRAWRKAGLTWAQIGKLLGVTRARAHQLGREPK